MNALEILLLDRLIQALKINSRPSVLFLGYPDARVDEATWPLSDIAWDLVPKREGADAIWVQHGLPQMQGQPMAELRALFCARGADILVADAIAWGGEDIVLDLNYPVRRPMRGRFDIIVDPGTLEHCFNIAQAFDNVDAMLKVGGYVYHEAAMSYANHGLWSISPTAFFDFYEPRGYDLGTPYRWDGWVDANSLYPRIEKVSPFEPRPNPADRGNVSYLFRKTTAAKRRFWQRRSYPIQRCYSSNSRTPPMIDFIGDLDSRDD